MVADTRRKMECQVDPTQEFCIGSGDRKMSDCEESTESVGSNIKLH